MRVSRREIISSTKKEDKKLIIEKYSEGMIIKMQNVKAKFFGAFLTVNGELDVLCHMIEASYSRINHPDEVFEVGKLYDVVVISVDKDNNKLVLVEKNFSRSL